MKKLITLPKWKTYLEIREKDEERRRLSQRIRRELKNRRLQKLSAELGIAPIPPSKRGRKVFQTLTVPKDFSLISNTDEVLVFFKKTQYYLSHSMSVRIDMSNVENLSSDAIGMLVANLSDERFTHGTLIQGNAPHNAELRDMLIHSGFFDHVQSRVPKTSGKTALIQCKKEKKVERGLAKEARLIASNHTFGKDIKLTSVYRTLIECMANTHDHAAKEADSKETWWLTVYNDPRTKITSFSFLDTGVGIFNSIKLRSFLRKVKHMLVFDNEPQLLEDILKGRIGSRTGEPFRGKGLPSIYTCFVNKKIHRLIIISNNVHANLEEGNYKKLHSYFKGTFLYWEVRPN